nr:zf-HC2 domain-containing protein [Micromonospora sp. HM5-17]
MTDGRHSLLGATAASLTRVDSLIEADPQPLPGSAARERSAGSARSLDGYGTVNSPAGCPTHRGRRQDGRSCYVPRLDCAKYRELISASLDGELEPDRDNEVESHLQQCAACRRWYDEAAHLTRLARVTPVLSAPDLAERIIGQMPQTRRRHGRLLRWGLAVVGLAQGGWGALALLVLDPDTSGERVHGAALGHLAHESAAFNLALGVAFVWAAARPRNAAGLLPVLATFTGLMLAASLVDLTQGRVHPSREVAHLLMVLGLVLVAGRARVESGKADASVASR